MRQLDRRIGKTAKDIEAAVADSGSTLTELRGIATLTTGKIIARACSIHWFRSAAAFASYTGTAPIEASSGDIVRHRLSRVGDRQLNCCLHHHDGLPRSVGTHPAARTTNGSEPPERATRKRCAA
ncbi:transposase [Rhodococcus koreensis]